jgi:protein-S-isoprenylcysteine O-methyltransferase Ste14
MSPLAAAWATLLAVALYGALHSLLASLRAKTLARRTLGPASARWYRLGYNLIGALTLLPVLAIPARQPGLLLYRAAWPWSGLMLAGQALALVIILVGLLQTGLAGFLGLRQLLEGEPEGPPRLRVTGLYRWVRHPLYTAGLALLWLSPLMTTSTLALFIGLSLYLYIGSLFEERRMIREFGQAYREYQRRVPRLLPRPWHRAPEPRQAAPRPPVG